MKTSTYNMLNRNLRVAMVVKYVEDEDEAYWLLARDIEEPSDEFDKFSFRIPKENTLSTIDWSDIQEHVRRITDMKLAAERRSEIHAREKKDGQSSA